MPAHVAQGHYVVNALMSEVTMWSLMCTICCMHTHIHILKSQLSTQHQYACYRIFFKLPSTYAYTKIFKQDKTEKPIW